MYLFIQFFIQLATYWQEETNLNVKLFLNNSNENFD
jgi:hypothetical protein